MAISSWRSLFAALLILGACGGGGGSSSGTGGGAGTGASGGSSATAGTGGSGAGGSSAGAAGTGAPGGAGAGGSGNAGTGGSGIAGTGGSSGGGTSGLAGTAGGGTGGASNAGTSGSAGRGGGGGFGTGGRGGSASGGTGGSATGCTRELLRGTITAYFTALAAHSASTLPLASNVKFTENGKVMTLGQGLWMTAGAVKYSQSALDVEICSSATHAVVPEGSMDIPLALRLKLVDQQITEIETIAVRPGDYKLSGAVQPTNTAMLISANSTIMWETVPSGQRNTRAELTAWIDKYFRAFPMGVCNAVSSCRRLENGAGNFNCAGGGAGGSCSSGPLPNPPAMVPRVLIGDPETGIAVGMTMFMGNTDMHMIKMYGGQVYAVHAVLGGATSSGW